MAVRNLAFHLLSAVLSVLIVLSNWISYTVVLVLNYLKAKSCLARNITKRWIKVLEAGKRQILQYIPIIVNIILGLYLTKYLLSYHSFLIKTIVTISYQLHLISLNWVVDIPDYSAYLNDICSLPLVFFLIIFLKAYSILISSLNLVA